MSQSINELLSLTVPSPLQRFCPDWPGAEKLSLYIKRDDLIHPVISGNKWRKLCGLFTNSEAPPHHILSFGGGFSNHLHALGYLCNRCDITFTAIVRGDYSQALTPTLADLLRWHCQIQYVNRITYKKRHDADFLAQLRYRYPDALIVPEGGSSCAALAGFSAMMAELSVDFDYILTPVASGATLAGIASAAGEQKKICGIAVLKGQGYLESLVNKLLPQPRNNWHIDHRFHGGGYAKKNDTLTTFCREMSVCYNLPVEPVYSGKLFYALKKKIEAGDFADGSRLIVLHTGGMQGARN